MRRPESPAGVLLVPDAEASPAAAAARIVTVVAVREDGVPEVQLDQSGSPVAARLAVAVSRERLELAVAERQPAVVVFGNGDPSQPVIIGFVEPLVPEPAAPVADHQPIIEADVDGRRVRITAADEIVLECGQASVTLRRNGRVIIRGTYVETRSDGTNRIKGGQVQIN